MERLQQHRYFNFLQAIRLEVLFVEIYDFFLITLRELGSLCVLDTLAGQEDCTVAVLSGKLAQLRLEFFSTLFESFFGLFFFSLSRLVKMSANSIGNVREYDQ